MRTPLQSADKVHKRKNRPDKKEIGGNFCFRRQLHLHPAVTYVHVSSLGCKCSFLGLQAFSTLCQSVDFVNILERRPCGRRSNRLATGEGAALAVGFEARFPAFDLDGEGKGAVNEALLARQFLEAGRSERGLKAPARRKKPMKQGSARGLFLSVCEPYACTVASPPASCAVAPGSGRPRRSAMNCSPVIVSSR